MDAIRQLCSDFSKQMRVEVEFIADDSVRPASDDVALALYRVTQEALSNVARHSRSTSATVSLLRRAVAIQLTIADAGVGFDTTQLQSTDGLGLTSIRERASMLDAAFEVRSAPSLGTTIDLRVPVRDSTAIIACADQRRPRVLLGDDHHGVLTALVQLLAPSCEVVGCATDGPALLDAVAARHPDVLVVDMNMPSMTGFEVSRRIGKTAHTRTVMLTACDDATLRDTALAAGAAAFIEKSRAADDLLPAILKAFAAHPQLFGSTP